MLFISIQEFCLLEAVQEGELVGGLFLHGKLYNEIIV